MLIKGPNGRLTKEAIEEIRKRVINGESKYRVAIILGLSFPTVRRYTKDLPGPIKRKITDQMERQIRNAVKNGLERYEVCKIFNVSYPTVCKLTKDYPKIRGVFLRDWCEKFLLNIMKEGFFIPKKEETIRALGSCRILRKYGFKIKVAKISYFPPVYFPRWRKEQAIMAFLKSMEARYGKKPISPGLFPGIMRQFEIPKKEWKMILRECGH